MRRERRIKLKRVLGYISRIATFTGNSLITPGEKRLGKVWKSTTVEDV
jgi:hypothetical protein